MTIREIEKLSHEICNGLFHEYLDRSEVASIRSCHESGLQGTLYPVQYGSGGITSRNLDGTMFYVMLHSELDAKGFKLPRHENQMYYLLKNGEPHKAIPDLRSQSRVFRELVRETQLISAPAGSLDER